MTLPLIAEMLETFETPAESADKVRPHSAKRDLKREEAHCPPAASENFPKLGPKGKKGLFQWPHPHVSTVF